MPALGVKVSAIAGAIATQTLTLSGWQESAYIFESLGRDPASVAHLAFAIGTPNSTATGGRQNAKSPIFAATKIVVRFLTRVRPKDQVVSQREGLNAEDDLIRKLTLATETWPGTFILEFVDANRAPAFSSEWTRHDVTFTARHWLALT